MALALTTVADSIAALSVSGLTIRDINEVKVKGDRRISYLCPNGNYISDFTMERNSYGSNDAKMTVQYTLNYRLFYKPSGGGRAMTIEQFSGLVAMIALIWDAILAIDTIAGAIDVTPISPANYGPVLDPSDNEWWGCDLAFRVTEFVN